VINLENHDVILGTPFLWQHKMVLSFNPPKVVVGCRQSEAISGEGVAKISSLTTDLVEEGLERLCKQLHNNVQDLCIAAEDTPLPPLRAVNYRIPIVDEGKVYTYHPSRCPEALKPLWRAKRDKYLKSGQWQYHVGGNTIPMLLINKNQAPTVLQGFRLFLMTGSEMQTLERWLSPYPINRRF
jgi:hypothetical protein